MSTRESSHVPVLIIAAKVSGPFLLSRVPCVGEAVYLGSGGDPDRSGDPESEAGHTWRVVSVQHYPPQLNLDSVAEIHVVAADDFDKWGGEFPGAAAVLGR
jgi:hypothetical protein